MLQVQRLAEYERYLGQEARNLVENGNGSVGSGAVLQRGQLEGDLHRIQELFPGDNLRLHERDVLTTVFIYLFIYTSLQFLLLFNKDRVKDRIITLVSAKILDECRMNFRLETVSVMGKKGNDSHERSRDHFSSRSWKKRSPRMVFPTHLAEHSTMTICLLCYLLYRCCCEIKQEVSCLLCRPEIGVNFANDNSISLFLNSLKYGK